MTTKQKSWLVFGVGLLAMLPFLSEGYGKEFDAWSNALNARTIWESGQYEVSRLPGHPLYEILLSRLWPIEHGYFFFNLLSAIATAFSGFFLFRIARLLKIRQAFILALSFMAIPVVFIAGTYTIDYNFALVFILMACWAGLKDKPVLAGILLGIATGFRISSIGFLLPFSIFLWSNFSLRKHVFMWISAAVMASLAFLPPLLTYGLSFLDFHKPPFPSLANVIYKLTFGIWGLPLLIVIGFLSAHWIFKKRAPQWNKALVSQSDFIWGMAAIVAMQLVVFLRLPFKSEFFIPALPFIWLFLFSLARKRQAKMLALASLVSLVFFGFDYHQSYRGANASDVAMEFEAGGKTIFLDPWQGPLFIDQSKRKNKAELVAEVINSLESKPQPVWLIAGWYYPHLLFKYPDSHHHIDHFSSQGELDSALAQDWPVYYLPEIAEQNQMVEGHYLADSIGKPLIAP